MPEERDCCEVHRYLDRAYAELAAVNALLGTIPSEVPDSRGRIRRGISHLMRLNPRRIFDRRRSPLNRGSEAPDGILEDSDV